jgi:SAM-dependent methyltransferase
MVALQQAGWDVEGVEWDLAAGQIARESTGLPVWDGDFRSIDLPLASYHLVVLSHVIEHLSDPLSALRRIRQLLATGGRVVLEYPNPNALGVRLYGDKWVHWDPPRHLVIPPLPALARSVERAGFVALRARTSARYVDISLARSRAHTKGVPCDTNSTDRLIGFLERTLARLGFALGEEVVIELGLKE